MELFDTPLESPIIIILTISYFIVAAITTFDIRSNQAIKNGEAETPLPNWIAGLYWILWALWIWLFLLNWKYALIVFLVKFILKVLPVLEVIGNLLMTPFKKK